MQRKPCVGLPANPRAQMRSGH